MRRQTLTVLTTAALTLSCAQSTPVVSAGEGANMLGTVIRIAPESDLIVVGTVESSEMVEAGDGKVVRVNLRVGEWLSGRPGTGDRIVVDVPHAGKETPDLPEGITSCFFLRQAAGGWRLTDLSSPLTIPQEGREGFLALLKEYVQAAAARPAEPGARDLVLRFIETGHPFFVDDASRAALDIAGWTATDVARILAVLRGGDEETSPGGNARENLTYLVVANGAPEAIDPFIREELAEGRADGIYLGLDERDEESAGSIVRSLLEDPEPEMQAAGLRLAGLLRRKDLIDAYVAAHEEGLDDAMSQAVEEARKLVDRD